MQNRWFQHVKTCKIYMINVNDWENVDFSRVHVNSLLYQNKPHERIFQQNTRLEAWNLSTYSILYIFVSALTDALMWQNNNVRHVSGLSDVCVHVCISLHGNNLNCADEFSTAKQTLFTRWHIVTCQRRNLPHGWTPMLPIPVHVSHEL